MLNLSRGYFYQKKRIMKTHLILIVALILLTGSISAQDNKASLSLTAAIYEEEVSGMLDKAVELYLNILKKYPNDRKVCAKTLYRLGLVNEKMGKQKADEYFTRLVNTYPDQIEMVALAKAKLTLYNRAAAETTLKAHQSFNLAADLFKQSEYKSAITKYEKVINLDPKSQLAQEAQLWIGHCYFKLGKNEQALQSFNSIIKEFPQSNMIPVTELMIGQVKQAIAYESQNMSIGSLNENTILDPVTGIRFTKIHSFIGKNDIIKSASSIMDISPNRKFLLADGRIFPFDNGDSFNLFDTISSDWTISRLSPDATKIAYMTEKALSILPISPETGHPTGPGKLLITGQYDKENDFSWSNDGENLVLTLIENYVRSHLWTLAIKDGLLKLFANANPSGYNAVYAKNGANIIYMQANYSMCSLLKMKSDANGKSLQLLDSIWAHGRFILSEDNQWILYKKASAYDQFFFGLDDSKFLFRLADKQEQELSTPKEVGDFVSSADKGNKVFFFNSSYEDQNVIKVASVFGGPAFELGKQFGQIPVGWTHNNNKIIAEKSEEDKKTLMVINLDDQVSKTIEGISDYEFMSFSPDYSKILLVKKMPENKFDAMIFSVSLTDFKVSEEPLLIIEGFTPVGYDYQWGFYFSWSNDGKKIAICKSGDLWIYDADGGIPVQLTKTPTKEIIPKWSPDGNSIAVDHSRGDNSPISIIRVSDGEILQTFENVYGYNWTPDGKEITIAYKDGQLSSISLATGKTRKIANWKEKGPGITEINILNNIKWSPDGKWIALDGFIDGGSWNGHIHLINASNGKITEFAADKTEIKGAVFWSPDSKWISYSSQGPKKVRLESTLWEADLTDFLKTIKPGTETGYTTDYKIPEVPAGGVAPDGTFTDARDGHVYKYKNIGEQTWMAENLAYLPVVNPDSATSSVDKRYYVYGYEGSDVIAAKNTKNYQKFGVLYNWPAAMNLVSGTNSVASQGSCPSGWHVPSDAEWMILEKTLGMSEDDLVKEGKGRYSGYVGKKLKSPLGWDDDDILIGQSGFNALPAGLVYKGKAIVLNRTVYFWTSTTLNETKAVYRNFYTGPGMVRSVKASMKMGLSVRCVKD